MQVSKKSSTFAPAFEKEARQVDEAQFNGAVVQLVRIPACHAVGREFESRPHRKVYPDAKKVEIISRFF